MTRKKFVLYTFLLLLVMASIAAWYIYKEYNRTLKDTVLLKPDYSLSAPALIKEFTDNDSTAGKKYLDRVISVAGMVREVVKDEAGFNTIVLGDTLSMSSVRCSLDSVHNKEADRLQKGNQISVKGICAGFNASDLLGSDVIMVRCVVEE